MVNKFDDGEERFAHGWLRQNERDMATLAWELAATRERRGLGSAEIKPKKQLHLIHTFDVLYDT